MAVLGAVRRDRGHEIEPGPHGTLGIVLPGDGSPPDGHDGVADELLDHAPVARHDGSGQFEVARQQLSHLFRVFRLGEGSEPDEVAEHDRDLTQLGALAGRERGGADRRCACGGRCSGPGGLSTLGRNRCRTDGRPAIPAEAIARWNLGPAGGASGNESCAAAPTEPHSLGILNRTRRAAHAPTSCFTRKIRSRQHRTQESAAATAPLSATPDSSEWSACGLH